MAAPLSHPKRYARALTSGYRQDAAHARRRPYEATPGLVLFPGEGASCARAERAPAPRPDKAKAHRHTFGEAEREGAPIPQLGEGTPRAARSGAGPQEAGRTDDVP